MKILYISHSLPPKSRPMKNVGGMQKVSVQLMNALADRKDVKLKTITHRIAAKKAVMYTFLFLFRLLFLIPKAVKEFKPDVILFSSMVTAGVIPFLSKTVTPPMVAINHGQDVTLPLWIYQKYLPVVFKKLSGVISVSRATRQACIERGMESDKGIAIPNGMDCRNSDNLPSKEQARKKLVQLFDMDLDEDDYLLLTVGRQVKRKGHTWFIRKILPKIEQKVIYLVIGDGPEFERIKEASEQSECNRTIYLTGRQPGDVLEIAYAGADLFVMPNIPVEGDMEGFGVVLLEANQAGLPAIASDLEGIRDVIKQGVNGYRVPCNRPEEFARKIDEVLKSDLDVLSKSSRQYVAEWFSWPTVVIQYVSFLEEITLKNNRQTP